MNHHHMTRKRGGRARAQKNAHGNGGMLAHLGPPATNSETNSTADALSMDPSKSRQQSNEHLQSNEKKGTETSLRQKDYRLLKSPEPTSTKSVAKTSHSKHLTPLHNQPIRQGICRGTPPYDNGDGVKNLQSEVSSKSKLKLLTPNQSLPMSSIKIQAYQFMNDEVRRETDVDKPRCHHDVVLSPLTVLSTSSTMEGCECLHNEGNDDNDSATSSSKTTSQGDISDIPVAEEVFFGTVSDGSAVEAYVVDKDEENGSYLENRYSKDLFEATVISNASHETEAIIDVLNSESYDDYHDRSEELSDELSFKGEETEDEEYVDLSESDDELEIDEFEDNDAETEGSESCEHSEMTSCRSNEIDGNNSNSSLTLSPEQIPITHLEVTPINDVNSLSSSSAWKVPSVSFQHSTSQIERTDQNRSTSMNRRESPELLISVESNQEANLSGSLAKKLCFDHKSLEKKVGKRRSSEAQVSENPYNDADMETSPVREKVNFSENVLQHGDEGINRPKSSFSLLHIDALKGAVLLKGSSTKDVKPLHHLNLNAKNSIQVDELSESGDQDVPSKAVDSSCNAICCTKDENPCVISMGHSGSSTIFPQLAGKSNLQLTRTSMSQQDSSKPDDPKVISRPSSNDVLGCERVVEGKWSLGPEIGAGSFGVVHVGMNAMNGCLMAVKVLKIPTTNSRTIVQDLHREIDLMKSLDHPNIVRYLGAEEDNSKKILNIFQEWVPGGSISSLLKKFGPFSFPVIRSYLTQVLTGLDYLHSCGIIHRDIKGGNILVSNEGVAKLADFGASRRVEAFCTDPDTIMEELTMRGTPYFMAPEVFEEKYGPKADIWSVGGLLYQMATGSPPWKEMGFKNPISLFFYLKSNEKPPKIPPLKSSGTNNSDDQCILLGKIISRCFERDPSNRPTALTLLRDDFFLRPDMILQKQPIEPKENDMPNSELSDSLCYSFSPSDSLPENSGKQNFCSSEGAVDTSDWPEWAKKSEHTPKTKENSNSDGVMEKENIDLSYTSLFRANNQSNPINPLSKKSYHNPFARKK